MNKSKKIKAGGPYVQKKDAFYASVCVSELTEEEEKEIVSLRNQYDESIRQKKLEAFKALPPQVRQVVVDMRKAEMAAKEIDYLSVEVPERLRELETKRDVAERVFNHGISRMAKQSCEDEMYHGSLFYSFKDKELETAHAEAVVEEVVLDNKENA